MLEGKKKLNVLHLLPVQTHTYPLVVDSPIWSFYIGFAVVSMIFFSIYVFRYTRDLVENRNISTRSALIINKLNVIIYWTMFLIGSLLPTFKQKKVEASKHLIPENARKGSYVHLSKPGEEWWVSLTSEQQKKWVNVQKQYHPFHLVTVSPWPFITSCSAFTAAIGLVFLMHLDNYSSNAVFNHLGLLLLHGGLLALGLTLYRWFTDIVTEATFEGHHTIKVQQGLRYGVVLFIVSEIMFFFGFFWTFFHSSLSPGVSIGCVWPPKGIEVIKPFELPFLNTLILLSSGVSITWAHRALFAGNRRDTIVALAVTVFLGVIFTACQGFEYYTAPFSINDGIYGSIFYLTTGFHGFHVLIGSIFLLTNLWRQTEHHFTRQHHFGFEAGAWYWHFVDVVWIFLFITLYWWGS